MIDAEHVSPPVTIEEDSDEPPFQPHLTRLTKPNPILCRVLASFLSFIPYVGGLVGVLSIGLAATFLSATEGSAVEGTRLDEATWVYHKGAQLQVATPPTWSVEATAPDGDRESFLLRSPDGFLQMRLSVVPRPPSIDGLRTLERHLVRTVELEETFQHFYLHISSPTHSSGALFATIKYTAILDSGERIRGVRAGHLTPDNRLLLLDTTSGSIEYLRSNHLINRKIMASVALAAEVSDGALRAQRNHAPTE